MARKSGAKIAPRLATRRHEGGCGGCARRSRSSVDCFAELPFAPRLLVAGAADFVLVSAGTSFPSSSM